MDNFLIHMVLLHELAIRKFLKIQKKKKLSN